MRLLKKLTFTVLIIIGIGYITLEVTVFYPERQKQKAAQERFETANAMFKERCKKSGFFIHKTVDDVEGIFLMKIRPKEINYGDQLKLDDPYGGDTGAEGYIKNFLRGRDNKGSLNTKVPVSKGYHYVEAIDPEDGQRYRYTGSVKVVGRKDHTAHNIKKRLERNPNYDLNNYAYVLDKAPASGKPPRYGVTYDDISTREEREYWIAGSSLKVIDLETDEVIAERIGYMMDYGQGSRAGFRSPWLLAADNACPPFPKTSAKRPVQIHQTRKFVEKVLHIKQLK